ncbi:MAG TPA: addiction module protein [Thermoanaerobaculia bacterium]|jgi:putative addiction module component (TIGR02574 family)
MTKADLTRLALELPIDERLDLAQTLWDSASPLEDFTLTPELRDLLDAQLREAEANPDTSVTWEEMKARLLRRAFKDEPSVDPEEIAAWSREIEEAAARIPEEEHERFLAALAEVERESKEQARRQLGLP